MSLPWLGLLDYSNCNNGLIGEPLIGLETSTPTYLPLGIVAFYYDHDERLESYYSFRKTTRRNIKKAQQRPQAVLISLVVLRCQFRSFGRKSPFSPWLWTPL